MTRQLLQRPVATWVLFAALVVLGVYAMPKLRVESMPEVELPSLTVRTSWTGASPSAVHRSITVAIEEAVRRVHGIEEVVARSYPGVSIVDVSFRRDVNVEFARLELAEQLGAVRQNLPLNAQPPQIRADVPEEFRTEDYFTVALISPLDPNDLREEAEKWIVPQVMGVDGVASAEIRGGAQRILSVVLNREKLALQRLTADGVLRSIRVLDDVTAGGVVRVGPLEALVSIREGSTLKELSALVVARRGERLIRLFEIAEVRWDHEDPSHLVRINGNNMVMLSVEKRRGSNAVSVSRAVRAKLPEIARALPFPVTFEVDEDQGGELEKKLLELVYRSLMILGMLLLLLLISMRSLWLSVTIVASIILAVLISLSLFYFLNISVNFITISGLTVCFGMILDNSILVLDSVHRRVSEAIGGFRGSWKQRLSARQARRELTAGAGEVAFPILATTLTTMVAFLSFVFLSGRLSLYYAPLAVAVATAMGASILVALGWMPVALRSIWMGHLRGPEESPPAAAPGSVNPESHSEGALSGSHPASGSGSGSGDAPSERSLPAADRDPPAQPGHFERFVGLTLKVWWAVILLALGCLAAGWYIYQNKLDKGGFWRMPERETLILSIRLPEGTDVLMTYETMKRFEREILPVPEGVHARATVWRNRGFMKVRFDEKTVHTDLPLSYRYSLIDLAEKMAGMGIFIAGFDEQAYMKGFFGGQHLNSTIRITGYNSAILEQVSEKVLRRIGRSRRVRHARALNDMRYMYSPQDESVITVRRDVLKDYDLTVAEVVVFLSRLIGVDYPMGMIIDGEAERLQLSYDDSDEIEFSEVANEIIRTQSGKRVRLGDILCMETIPLAGPIVREDQRYARYVAWEYVGTESMRSRFIRNILETLKLPYGYAADEPEQSYLTEEEESELTLMLILAVAFIYMILAGLFESLTLPFLVLLSVPLSLVGVFAIFWLADSTFDSSARIGLILLFGIVVNNAILLVSRFRIEAQTRCRFPNMSPQGASMGGPAETEFAGIRGPFGLHSLPPGERLAILTKSICHGTRVRLRSILLTSGTTVVGLAPLLIRFEELEGKDIWENLALSSIGGLTASVILILLALPASYYISIRFGWFIRDHIWPRLRQA